MVKTENIQITYLSQIDSIRQLMIQDDYLACCNLITESPTRFLRWLLVEFRVQNRFGRIQVKINGINLSHNAKDSIHCSFISAKTWLRHQKCQ